MTDDTPTEGSDINEPGEPTEPIAPNEPLVPTEALPVTEPLAPDGADATVLLPAAGATATATEPLDPEKKSRTLLWVLIGIGGALLIAIIIVLLMLFNRGDEPTPVATETTSPTPSPTPTESDTPSPTPTPSETEEPPPAVVGPTFDSFDAQPSAGCVDGDVSRPLTFSWSSSNADHAYIGVDTLNAKNEPFNEGTLPPVFTYTDLNYQCDQTSQIYTVTLEDAAGLLAHQTVTISK